MVGDALAKGGNQRLEVLRLQYNEIDAKGLQALATAASGSGLPRLRRVELNGNKFSEEDPSIEKLQTILAARKDEQASEYPGVDEDDEDAWGLDELDELDDDDEDEDEDEDEAQEDAEEEAEEEKVVKEADEVEDEPVTQKQDKDVDELADALGKTQLK